ncbi:NCS2 family permease [Myceligenerans crystallogenes]|uniref:NCS2 family permease n=1 Tax=Myceligenerans crystallogenes TaxID=316335 RepID=A0ABN2NDB3_9MICO
MATTAAPARGAVDRYFRISERGSTIVTEIRGGVVTFFTMAYIVVLNPLIIGTVPDGTGSLLGGGEGNLPAIAAATALVAGVLSILMGTIANYPMALAAGLGLNAVVAFSIAALPEMTWADAMGLVVLEGLIILVLVLTGLRQAVFNAVPHDLKLAISVGIGLFIAFIGLVDAGFVRIPASMATPVELGIGGSLSSWPLLVFVIGLLLTVVLMVRKVKGAILIGILASTVLAVVLEAIVGAGGAFDEDGNPVASGWRLNVPALPENWFGLPDLSLLGQFSLFGSFEKIGPIAALLLVFTLLIADFFDTMGTMVAIGGEAKLLDAQGNPPRTKQILVVDSIAAAAGGAASVSSNTSYIESASGVGEGARTGLASVVTGLCFLVSMFFVDVVKVIPYEAATPALVVVGLLMVAQITGIDWKNLEIAVPAFLGIILMPFSYSITAGIGAAVVTYVVIKLAVGKARQVHPLLWVTAALFLVYFLKDTIGAAVGV